MSSNQISNIELSYYKAIESEFQWFLICEFKISETAYFQLTDKEILESLIKSKIMTCNLDYPDLNKLDINLNMESITRPYEFEKIRISDFNFIESKTDLENWLQKFKTEGWEDDRENAQVLITKAENEIKQRTKIKNGIWHLAKDSFHDESDKLSGMHWVYIHFETFIEVDRESEIIRTFDFGYD